MKIYNKILMMGCLAVEGIILPVAQSIHQNNGSIIAAIDKIVLESEQQDAITTSIVKTEKRLDKEVINELKTTVPPKNFFSYDDQQKLKSIESAPLQQIGGDVIDAVAFNFEDIDLQNVAEYI